MDEDSDHEVFEDAVEDNGKGCDVDLERALMESRLAVTLFFNNKFDEAKQLLEPWVGKSIYHTFGESVFKFLEAVMTYEKHAIEQASIAVKCSLDLSNRHRKKQHSIGKMVRRPKYEQFTPEEMHAELCYAEALLLKSMLLFIEDETLVNFIKAGMKIRYCYNSYKECSNILKSRDWSGVQHFVHFQSGVHLGIGVFNLMISLLPTRIIKLLEFIGFSGSKELGLEELMAGYKLDQGLRQVLSIMTLLVYNLFAIYMLSHQEGNLKLCEEILEEQLQRYPEGVWFLYFRGRLEFMNGNIPEAITWYLKSWESQSEWPQFHHLCEWELMWIYFATQDWKKAECHAASLLEKSRWSPTIYGYQKMSALLMQESNDPAVSQEIQYLVKSIPLWKQRIAGKSLPIEKFCIKKCERFKAQQNTLVLPAIELLYVWNYFKVLSKRQSLSQAVYKLVLQHLVDFDEGKYSGTQFEYDNQALLLLLKGSCLHIMKRPYQAEECLKSVISLEKQIKDDLYIIPFALVELALVYHTQEDTKKAIQVLENVKKNYTGYSLESRLHFRIHSALMDFNSVKK
ncbi:IHypothetical protein2 [Nesidiocoris tenuis]|uniref:Tetratricopeptide repeat protein 39B n=1 Tax=Nesidiocoris tenuis TaxID=355587 RepID=A0ABN7AFW7_9HEMI|nr:IHypothetical protein2 [Nesidiocoris tenuis]